MNREGTIIASGDSSRIGTIHEGALEVIKTGEARIISSPKEGGKTYNGAKPGINLPIRYEDEILGVVGITGEPKKVLEFGSIVVMMAELLIERSIFQNESEWRYRTKTFLMEECLKEHQDLETIQFQLKGLGLKLEPPFQIAVFRIKDGRSPTHDRFAAHEQIKNRLIELPALFQYVNDFDFVLLWLSPETNRFQDVLSFLNNVFKGHFHHVQVGLPQAFEQIADARFHFNRTLQTLNMTREEKVYPENFETQLLISRINDDYGKWYVKKRLQELPANLIDTLIVFFNNHLNMSQAAKELFIHRNTLIYRLDRVQTIVGLDPRQFKDAVELQLAIWLYCTKTEGS